MSMLTKFENFYRNVTLQSIADLADVYDAQAVLIDPVSTHVGLENIQFYFQNMLTNTEKCECLIEQISEVGDRAFVTWKMIIAHPKLNSGVEFQVNGISHLESKNQKIIFHRDYYDLGEMLYEQVPLLKHVIKSLKRRLSS